MLKQSVKRFEVLKYVDRTVGRQNVNEIKSRFKIDFSKSFGLLSILEITILIVASSE